MHWFRFEGLRTLALLTGLVLASSCVQPTSHKRDSQPTTPTQGTLTIINGSSQALDFVTWSGGDTTVTFGPDEVFDSELNKTVPGMNPGSSQTLTVSAGSAPLCFFLASGGYQYQTTVVITVKGGGKTTFTITDETEVVQL